MRSDQRDEPTPKPCRKSGPKIHLAATAATRVAVNLKLPQEILTRLKVHSLATQVSASDIVARLIDANLTDFEIVPRPAGRSG